MAKATLPEPALPYRPTVPQYVAVGAAFVAFGLLLSWLIQSRSGRTVLASQLVSPMLVLTLLICAVWVLMIVVRNVSLIRGLNSADYYRDYHTSPPAEWVERPARTFNNLMQAPQLFYAVCLAMLATNRCDAAQLAVAWAFVATRIVHAAIYMLWNYIPARFAAWNVGMIALSVLWVRFWLQSGLLW
jgi:hypothetical protein